MNAKTTDPWDDIQAHVSAQGGPEFATWIEKTEWLALAWLGEVGEACNVVKKIRRNDSSILTAERFEKLRSELVDSMVYLLILLDHIGVPASSLPVAIDAAHTAFLNRK